MSDPETEIDLLKTMSIAGLRFRWEGTFKTEPPKAFGPDLLRRSLAQKIQEDLHGGLPATTRKLLNQLMAQGAKSSGKIVAPRQIKPGAILIRQWKGKTHRVTVLANGFLFQNKPFSNLSEIARSITGARWNGPRFFGLRNAPDSPA